MHAKALRELEAALGDWTAPSSWMAKGRDEMAKWNAQLDELQAPSNAHVPSYAQVIKVIQGQCQNQ
jgi:3D-(3,5/4)-trihydroxycyclohexane-1,2-dione acylhydrolase (decyclizing)